MIIDNTKQLGPIVSSILVYFHSFSVHVHETYSVGCILAEDYLVRSEGKLLLATHTHTWCIAYAYMVERSVPNIDFDILFEGYIHWPLSHTLVSSVDIIGIWSPCSKSNF